MCEAARSLTCDRCYTTWLAADPATEPCPECGYDYATLERCKDCLLGIIEKVYSRTPAFHSAAELFQASQGGLQVQFDGLDMEQYRAFIALTEERQKYIAEQQEEAAREHPANPRRNYRG
jgi:hypothetical protein